MPGFFRSQIVQSLKSYCKKETYQKAKDGFKALINDYVWNASNVHPSNKAILITGCDYGFGHSLARKLDKQGFQVFASCLNPADPGAMDLTNECSERLRILPLDVRKEDSVQDAVKYIKHNLGRSKLYAVVNSAGIRKGSSFDFSTIDDYKECLDVNALGMIRVTKAFLPMLKKSQGRVINLNCILGRVPVPHCSAYVMSQFAAIAFNDCMRQELNVWGIRVISVEPEFFKTQMTNSDEIAKTIDEAISSTDESIMSLYGTDYLNKFKKYAISCTSLASNKIFVVLKDLQTAVTLEKPWPTYRSARNTFTKFLMWYYEYMMHGSRDALQKFVSSRTKFPKPKFVEESEQRQYDKYFATRYGKENEKVNFKKEEKTS